jgi:hypothetical protein
LFPFFLSKWANHNRVNIIGGLLLSKRKQIQVLFGILTLTTSFKFRLLLCSLTLAANSNKFRYIKTTIFNSWQKSSVLNINYRMTASITLLRISIVSWTNATKHLVLGCKILNYLIRPALKFLRVSPTRMNRKKIDKKISLFKIMKIGNRNLQIKWNQKNNYKNKNL